MDGTKNKILIIEDSIDTVNVMKDMLEYAGYDVYTSIDGIDGLSQAKKVKPDAILLDIMLPKLSGIEVYKRLQEDDATRDIPVIVVSVMAMDQKVIEMSMGKTMYRFEKPFIPGQVLEALQAEIGKRKKQSP